MNMIFYLFIKKAETEYSEGKFNLMHTLYLIDLILNTLNLFICIFIDFGMPKRIYINVY